MTWHEKIIEAHTAVTDAVSHGGRMKSDRYFVWQEDSTNDYTTNNVHSERAVSGTTDLFTKQEFDPWVQEFEDAMNARSEIAWSLNSIQFEEDTGFWHYEWVWEVPA